MKLTEEQKDSLIDYLNDLRGAIASIYYHCEDIESGTIPKDIEDRLRELAYKGADFRTYLGAKYGLFDEEWNLK